MEPNEQKIKVPQKIKEKPRPKLKKVQIVEQEQRLRNSDASQQKQIQKPTKPKKNKKKANQSHELIVLPPSIAPKQDCCVGASPVKVKILESRKQFKKGQNLEQLQRIPQHFAQCKSHMNSKSLQKKEVKSKSKELTSMCLKIECKNCGEEIDQLQDYLHHIKKLCPMIATICNYCNRSFPIMLFQEHLAVCQRYQSKLRNRPHPYCPPTPPRSLHPIIEWSPNILAMAERDCRISSSNLSQLTCVEFQQQQCGNQDSCSICAVEFIHEERLVRLGCGHLFHIYCISNWFKKSPQCPFCKKVAEIFD